MATTWYLEAIDNDPATNEYLAHVIDEQNLEHLCTSKLCADKKRRNLFRCPVGYTDVRNALAAISQFNLKIDVFKEEIEGVIIRYDLWKKSSRKRAHQTSFPFWRRKA